MVAVMQVYQNYISYLKVVFWLFMDLEKCYDTRDLVGKW